MISGQFARTFSLAASSPDSDLAAGALMIARIEYPQLAVAPYVDQLDALGREAKRRLAAARDGGLAEEAPAGVDPGHYAQVMALNGYLYGELGFTGNQHQYEDPRNSFLNQVLERRTGLPITLGVLYIEVARRAGLDVQGINFPGHFLLRSPAPPGVPGCGDLVIDAFHAGAVLSRDQLQHLAGSVGALEDPLLTTPGLLPQAGKRQILTRMLINLKRVYVRMHSFPQARDVTELLLAIDPSAVDEMRDRGLLAYHLKDFSGALRDLSTYLELSATSPLGRDDRSEHAQIWEQVKSLRKRVASFN